jgi:transposase
MRFWSLEPGRKAAVQKYDRFSGDTFLEFLNAIHSMFPKCHLMDKASPHHRSRKVKKYFEENNDTLVPACLPTASPEFMVMEEVWNIALRPAGAKTLTILFRF